MKINKLSDRMNKNEEIRKEKKEKCTLVNQILSGVDS